MPNSPRDIVMMVDDDADELGMLGEAMEHAGFGTLAAVSGKRGAGAAHPGRSPT